MTKLKKKFYKLNWKNISYMQRAKIEFWSINIFIKSYFFNYVEKIKWAFQIYGQPQKATRSIISTISKLPYPHFYWKKMHIFIFGKTPNIMHIPLWHTRILHDFSLIALIFRHTCIDYKASSCVSLLQGYLPEPLI